MPNCTHCNTPLPFPINEYGPRDAPLCRTCFLTLDNRINDPEFELAAIRDEVRELADLIRAEDLQIWRLRSRLQEAQYQGNYADALDDLQAEEEERDALREKQGKLWDRQFKLLKAVKAEREREQMRLMRWMEGANA